MSVNSGLRHWRKLAGVVAAMIIAIGAATQGGRAIDDVSRTWRTSASSFDVFLTELGEFEAQRSAALASQLPGNKARIIFLVAAGTFVQPGDVIAEFDTSSFKEELARLDADLAEAQIQLERSEAEIALKRDELKTTLHNLRDQLELAQLAHTRLLKVDLPLRLQTAARELEELQTQQEQATRKSATMHQLFERGFASNDELRAATDLEKKAVDKLQAGQSRLRLLEQVELPGELRHSEVGVTRAQTELDEFDGYAAQQLRLKDAARDRGAYTVQRLEDRQRQIEQYIEQSVVTSPVAGFVDYPHLTFGKDLRRVQVGDAVWRAQPFVVIPDLESIIAKIQVREADVGSLAAGQTVRVRPSAFRDLILSGTVISVGTLVDADAQTGERRFEVQIALDDSDARLRPGMTANVRVHTHHYDETLLVPVEAVYFDNQQSFIYVRRGHGLVKQLLGLGGNDGRYVAVTTGLSEGDAVAYDASSKWLVDD